MAASEPQLTPTTSVTLLGRLRDPADAVAWREFDARYRELIVSFLRRRGLQVADAEDAAQIVVKKLVSAFRTFEYDATKRGFRAYLYRCTQSVMADHFARQAGRGKLVSLNDGELGNNGAAESEEAFAAFEREWVDHHYRLAARRYRASADERSIAVLEATMANRGVRTIADDLGMTEAAVYKAQQRLRERLSELIAEQLRDEELNHEQRTG